MIDTLTKRTMIFSLFPYYLTKKGVDKKGLKEVKDFLKKEGLSSCGVCC